MKIAKRIMIIFGVTIAIIAFATWWPSYTAYRIRGYDIAAKEDLKKLYEAAQSYFIEKPNGTFDLDIAKKYGYTPASDIEIKIEGGQKSNFRATSHHIKGKWIFTVNSEPVITEKAKEQSNR